MLVSIVIPTKNRRDLLRETLNSVFAQTYANWEAIIVDDGSTDGTQDVVQAMALTEKRVRFLQRQRNPPCASTCRNIGVSAAKGEYVIFLDSDDLLAPTCVEHRVSVMEKDEKLDFAVFLTLIFESEPGDRPYLYNKYTTESDLDRFLRRDAAWHTTGPIWRKTSLARIGPWDERALTLQDYEFHVRAIAGGLNYCKISEVDSFWRMTRPNSMTNYRSWKSPRRIWSRVRLFARIIAVLRRYDLMTDHRRRLLAADYYEHAFMQNDRRSLAYKILAMGRREGVVGNFKYVAVIAGDLLVRIVRRINNIFMNRLFPELLLVRTYWAPLSPEVKTPKFSKESGISSKS